MLPHREHYPFSICCAAYGKMHIGQYDVTTAYLNGMLEEEVFVEVPKLMKGTIQYMIKREQMDHQLSSMVRIMLKRLKAADIVCHMKKVLYGFKQAGRTWHKRLDGELRKLDALPSKQDPCLYLKNKGEE